MKIKDLTANQTANIHLMLTGVEARRDKNKNPFLCLSLTDGEKSINAFLFRVGMDEFAAKIGDILNVELEVREYNGGLSYSVFSYSITSDDPEQFVRTAPISAEKMYDSIHSFSKQLGVYAEITTCILEEYKDKLLIWGAGKRIHHDIRGGLLYHMYRMLQAANKLFPVYKDILNRDLLFSGVILHDIGKVYELECSSTGSIDYTCIGGLEGHLYIGAEIIGKLAELSGLDKKQEMLLKHMILSHHGKLETGAVVMPAIPEARVLNHLDCIDMEMYIFEQTRKDMEPDSISGNIFGLDSRIYNP